ncbi:MAG TPA: beta-ketoacyl synthase N-terminal-like domain-containing protein, partial [Micromonosporaceae bacterium]
MKRRSEASVCPIAIVGSACLLPGADSPERFWANLMAGSDERSEGGPEVFGTDPATPGAWGDAEHHIAATVGGFVREPDIDLSGLRLPAERVAALGAVVRWPLHVARRALADAGVGLDDPVLARTGLLLGNYPFPTAESVARCVPLIRDGVAEGLREAGLPAAGHPRQPVPPPETLWPSGLPATVVADALGLGGPRLALDAACASALYSLELGRRYLATGQVDMVLAGAVCAPDPLLIHLCFSDLHAYPDNGVSQPFAADSSGIVTGQGAGLFVLKRLADAVRDGDTVHAVISAVGIGNDGAGAHLLAPNPSGQVETYRLAGDRDVDYVECHATGTPLGDSTELRGLVEFFGSDLPLLGSVKGNIGHLLNAAGFTSVLKTVLAMQRGVIPATRTGARLIRPQHAPDVTERVVRDNTRWPDTGRGRRAAVSAFGFGGANAHLILDVSPAGTDRTEPVTPPVAPPRLAVAGLGVRLAGIRDVAELSRASRDGRPLLTDRPTERWHGLGGDAPASGHLERLRVDVRTYRIPPLALRNTNEQHLALFEAADQALAEAGVAGPGRGVRSGDLPPRRIAVVVAMEMEPWSHAHRARFDIGAFVREQCPGLDEATLERLEAGVRDAVHDPIDASEVLSYIGNIMASRISASRNLTGPSFTVSGDVTVGARALEVAALLLSDPTVEAVLVGAVDLAAGLENTLARIEQARAAGEPTPPLGDGAAAVVLTRATDEAAVVVDGLGFGHGADASREAVAAACAQAGMASTDVEYVELTTGTAELPALAAAYGGGEPHRCAVAGMSPLVGDVQRASFLVGLVRAAVALREATLPAAPEGWQHDAERVLAGSSLFLAEAPQPWLRRDRGGRRVAAVSGVAGECAAHAVLSCATVGPRRAGDPDVLVLPVRADDPTAMARRLRQLLDRLDGDATGAAVMRDAVADPTPGRYCAVLVAEDTARLRNEVVAAERDLPRVLADGGEWATPAGSFCTGQPVGSGKVAFVYPGAFTSYPGMSRDLFRLFPELLAGFEAETDAPAARYQHAALFPRSAAGMRRRDLMRHETNMIDDIPMMLAAGTNTAVLHTRLLRDILGVRPDGAFGYSLGESSMLFALDVWAATARDDRALAASPLFIDRLRGAKTLIRDTWGLPPDLPDRRVWQSRVVLAPAGKVAAALVDYDRLYLTHVNTDGETVIAGDPGQLDEFASATGFSMARAPANHVMHVALVEPVRVELAGLNDYPTGSPAPGLTLLSGYDYTPIPAGTVADRAALAERNSHTLCRPV